MDLTEFAERIVFGTTLDDKLLSPGQLSHDSDSSSRVEVDSLASPGREKDLRINNRAGAAPPRDNELTNEQARGQLLHFLANHELLATELMALVLLKFPDAPHAFRRGVFVTLQEEQQHTRMYLQRMKQCGVEFGSFPLSGHFWRIVEPMRSPMDFVSRLSLTFEQANLDYSRHFAKLFYQLGDLETAKLLEQIYQDEIGHVQHGLHWFRQWKDPNRSDWEAYKESLSFPMSPQRARGPQVSFNRQGRIEAGLDEEFIDAIEVFRQSRGRTPIVRWFDAAAEANLVTQAKHHPADAKVSQASSPSSNQLMHQLNCDLEGTMIATCKQDDVLLVHRMPSIDLQKRWTQAGFNLAEFVLLDEISSLQIRTIDRLEPWAWTPTSHDHASVLLDVLQNQPAPWRAESIDLYRKTWSVDQLRGWLVESPTPDWFVQTDCVGVQVTDFAGFKTELSRLATLGYSNVLFKQDLATSGRGQRRFSCNEPMDQPATAWLEAALRTAGCGVVEPELERILDLSFLWNLPPGADEPEFLGWTRPLVSEGRRYMGTRMGKPFSDCDSLLKKFLLSDRNDRLQTVRHWLAEKLTPELLARAFTGNFGVDALVCRNASGGFQIKPFVELNPRTTMGHIALQLEKRLAPAVTAEFRVLTSREWQKHHERLSQLPLLQSERGLWQNGFVPLGDFDACSKLIPIVLVGAEAIDVAP